MTLTYIFQFGIFKNAFLKPSKKWFEILNSWRKLKPFFRSFYKCISRDSKTKYILKYSIYLYNFSLGSIYIITYYFLEEIHKIREQNIFKIAA